MNHRTIEKPIPDETVIFFEKYDPDLIALNEYVDGNSRADFRNTLEKLGYSHQLLSTKIGKHNQVFLASKSPLALGDIAPPELDAPAKTNFLHAVLPEKDIELIGLRAPSYKLSRERSIYWQRLSDILIAASDRKILIFGDINYDPFMGLSASAPKIQFDLNGSYEIPNPVGEWSFISIDGKNKTRIDHVIVPESLAVSNVSYLPVYDGIVLAGARSDAAITDHAVLSMDVCV